MNSKLKTLAALLALALISTSARAQQPWRLSMQSPENDITLRLDLYEESIDVPGMSLFGPMNGYIAGPGVYGVWMVTSFRIDSPTQALIHLSNDQGSETQAVRLTLSGDTLCTFEQTGGTTIKKAVNHKLVKVPSKMVFKASAP